MDADSRSVGRRAVIAGLGLAGVGAAALADTAIPAADAATAPWRARSEPQDGWLERPAHHRLVIDVTSPKGIGAALMYADNFFIANKSGYGLDPADLAVVIILRHTATPFAYTDAVWARYGAPIAKLIDYQPLTPGDTIAENPYLAKPSAGTGGRGPTLDGLAGRGAQFAVCGMAAEYMVGDIAGKTHARKEEVQSLLLDHLIPNAHMTAAGIVALNRAQEHGYALAITG